jgi:diaminopimelate decarboxylase
MDFKLNFQKKAPSPSGQPPSISGQNKRRNDASTIIQQNRNKTLFPIMNLNYQLLEELSKLYGDSFYLLSTKQFTDNYDALLEAFRSYYPNTAIAYSYKTNYTPRLCLLVDQKGGYAEVVSEMEYDLAIKIGVDPQRIIVNGPYKERRALEKYLLSGSTVHLDSLHEVGLTMELAQCHRQAEFLVSIRCNFQISDGYTSRFGIDVDSNDFIQSIEYLRSVPNIRFRGLHCHFPDRNLDSFKVRMDKMLDLLGKSFPEGLEYLDLGGGYFGKMTQELEAQFSCTVPDYSDYAWEIAGRFSQFVAQQNWGKRPQLIIEPGTAIVADVMKFVARIMQSRTSVKENCYEHRQQV